MENISVFAFYGSLRRGMENYKKISQKWKYLFSARIPGYAMHLRGKYPFAVKSSAADSIVVEVFRIDDKTEREKVHELELSEGYHLETISIDGTETGIYLFAGGENYPKVDGGDWVTFFREKRE